MIRCFKMTWFSPTVVGEGFLFSGKKIETTKANSTFSHCQPDKFHILDSNENGRTYQRTGQRTDQLTLVWSGGSGEGGFGESLRRGGRGEMYVEIGRGWRKSFSPVQTLNG